MNKQSVLFSKPEEKPSHALVYADHREKNSGILDLLVDFDFLRVKQTQLPVGDFLVSEEVCIERKAAPDFLASIKNGRVFEQAQAMKDQFAKPLILIEGTTRELYELGGLHPNAVRGAISALATDYSVSAIFTADVSDTAAFIAVLAKREQITNGKNIRLQGNKRVFSLSKMQQFIVESLPGIGPKHAQNLLREFGSVERIFRAGEKSLKRVPKIGDKKARAIRQVLSAKFEQN